MKECLKTIGCVATLLPISVYAQSSVTLYGLVDNGIAYTSNQTTLGSTSNGKHNFMMTPAVWDGSKFGLLGKEDLSGGTYAIFNLMSRFNSANGSAQYANAMFGQQAYVGLTNAALGTLTLGRQLTSYFQMLSPFSLITSYSAFYGAHPGDIDNLDTDYKTNNTVLYTTPEIHGLTASASYAFSGIPGGVNTGSSWSAGLQYKFGGFGVGAGFERFNNANSNSGAWNTASTALAAGEQGVSAVTNGYQGAAAQQRFAITGKYTFAPNLNVSFAYSNVQYIPGPYSEQRTLFKSKGVWNTFGAVVNYLPTPAWNFAAGYSFTRASAANGILHGAQYQQIAASVYYALSKTTGLYEMQAFQRASGQTLGTKASSIISATATIGDGFNGAPSAGRNQFAIGAGVIHRF
ncbi:porin [Paraburkholderia xenovorans]